MTEVSHRAKLIRSTVLSVIGRVRAPRTTSAVIDAVVERVANGDVREITIIDRHEVRCAMVALERHGKLVSSGGDKRAHSRGRRSGNRHSRAVRGTITWELPRNAAADSWVRPA